MFLFGREKASILVVETRFLRYGIVLKFAEKCFFGLKGKLQISFGDNFTFFSSLRFIFAQEKLKHANN